LSAEERVRYDALRVWRSATAKAIGWPAFRVSPNRALAAIAARDPRDEDELAGVSGVGPWLVENYGAAVLEVLRALRDGSR
jgi:superfamily II DNA helicase RecQ